MLKKEITSDPGSEDILDSSEDLFKKVQDIVNHLIKTVKIFCIYPPDNPIPREFRNNFFKKLTEFLEENKEIKLGVDQSKLSFGDKIILKEEKEDEGITFALYRDGIREITVQKGIDQEELFSFLEILTGGLKSASPEDDLVTLFWEKELTHIKFLVVDEFLSEDFCDLPGTTGSRDFRELYYSEVNLADKDLTPQGNEKEERTKRASSRSEIEQFSADLSLIPQQGLEELKALLEKDKGFDPLKETFSILKEVFWVEKEFPEFSETVYLLEKILDSLVERGDFYLASEVLLLLKELEKAQTEAGQADRAKRIREALNRAGDQERIKILTQILNQNPKLDFYSATKYFSLLSWNAIPHLVDMLGELENFSARKMVCSILECIDEKNINLLAKAVYDRRWYVVRNIVGVLGRIGSPLAIPYLKKTITHEDQRVRKVTLEALSLIQSQEVIPLLLNTLEDPDERIRIRAAKLLSQRQSLDAFNYISNLITATDFKDRKKEEKESLLEALAKTGKDEAVPLLKKLILKKAWLKREKQKETSYLALKTLATIDSPRKLDNLKELCSKGSKKIRQQARALFERFSSQVQIEKGQK